MTAIYELREGNPDVIKIGEYSVEPKEAMVDFIQQFLFGNYNTWTYPQIVSGMRESKIKKDHWYYDDISNKRVLVAYPF